MARDILPTPILEGNDVIEFYNKLANFKENLEKDLMLKKNSLEGLSFFQLKENYPIKPFDCGDDDLSF